MEHFVFTYNSMTNWIRCYNHFKSLYSILKLTMDDKKDSKYHEGKASLKRERSFMSEHRFETLQSLSRLVENDFKSEMQETEQRRVSLPTMTDDHVTIEPVPGYWRRNSSVVDYMQELTTKRREMIQRLVPHIEQKADTSEDITSDGVCERPDRDVNMCNLKRNGQLSPVNISTVSEPDLLVKSGALSDEMDTNASDKGDTLSVIRERIAKFESVNSIPRRSINADDFQQFLGARYLEIYQKRAGRNSVSKDIRQSFDPEQDSFKNLSRYKNGVKETSQGHLNRSLNSRIRSLSGLGNSITGDSKSLSQNLKITLPPILKGRETDRKCMLDNRRSALELNSRYVSGFVPIHNDLLGNNVECSRTKGIPHHTAKRANKRYHESREIHSILSELRKLSSTVQKSEQEDFIHKLDDDYY